MPTILIKKKDTSGAPVAGDLTNSSGGAEIAVNTADKRLYTKNSGGTVVELGTNPATFQINSAFSFPTSDGTNGQILQTNGSGVLSWTAAGAGDVTLNGTQTLTNKTLTDPAIIGAIKEDVYTITDGAAFEIDPGNGSIQLITLGANRTPKGTNFAAGESVLLMVEDGTAYALTWTDTTFGTGGVIWKTDSGAAPTLNTTGYTGIVLWKVGTQVYGARVGDA